MKKVISNTSIFNAKQVADITYWVRDAYVLSNIIKNGEIVTSQKPEFNVSTKDMMSNHVSFSRGMRPHLRNRDRWRIGIKLDGAKLSARYAIQPYSYLGSTVSNTHSSLIVEYIRSFSDSSFTCKFVDWPEIPVERNLYKKLKSLLSDHSDYSHVFGSDADRTLIESYELNHNSVGLPLTYDSHFSIMNEIAQQTLMNEEEERIWATGYTIDVSRCMQAIIVPNDVELTERESSIIREMRALYNLPIVEEVSSKV